MYARDHNHRPQKRHPPSGARGGMALNNQNRQRPTSSDSSNGSARRNYVRYLALAKDAASSGDMIETENCFQHAEHYFRTMGEQAN